MDRSYWSLRNETEDVERALAQGDVRWARLAAFELGIRLSTTAAPSLQAGGVTSERRADSDDQPADEVLLMLEQELSRLVAFLKQDEPTHAAEVVELLFSHLDTLENKGAGEERTRGGPQPSIRTLRAQPTRP